MAQCSSNFHPELLQIHMYICYCVLLLQRRKLPVSICILSFYMPSFSLLCLFFSIFYIYFSAPLGSWFSYSRFVFSLSIWCLQRNVRTFQMEKRTKKEYESWLFVNKRKKKKPTRTQCKNGTSVLNFCVPYSSCHQFYSRQTRLFYFIIYSKFMYTERCTIYICALRREPTLMSIWLTNNNMNADDVDGSIKHPKLFN